MGRRGRPPHPDRLTPRESEVLALLAQGLTNEQIASRLGISESGARYHVSEILSKLGVGSRQEAAAWMTRRRRRSSGWLPAIFANVLGKAPAIARFSAITAIGLALVGLLAIALGSGAMSSRSAGLAETASPAAASLLEPSPTPEVSVTPDPAAQRLVTLAAEAMEAALTRPPDVAITDNEQGISWETPGTLLEETPELILIQVEFAPDTGLYNFRFTEVEPAHWFVVMGPDNAPSPRWHVTRQDIPNLHIGAPPTYFSLDISNLQLSPQRVIEAVEVQNSRIPVWNVTLVPAPGTSGSALEWVAFLGSSGATRCEVSDFADLSLPSAVRCGHPSGPPPVAIPSTGP